MLTTIQAQSSFKNPPRICNQRPAKDDCDLDRIVLLGAIKNYRNRYRQGVVVVEWEFDGVGVRCVCIVPKGEGSSRCIEVEVGVSMWA